MAENDALNIGDVGSNPTLPTKTRKKRSPIWLVSKLDLETWLNKNLTLSEIIIKVGLKPKGSNFYTLKQRLKNDGLTYNYESAKIKQGRNKEKIPLENILIKNSNYSRTHLKPRLIKENIIKYECAECGIIPFWNNVPLTLVLDHINGISNDNSIENLRFLCPNCNSQTETFAGRNKKY